MAKAHGPVAAMEDSRFIEARPVKAKALKKLGLHWFAKHLDDGYFVEEAVTVNRAEADAYAAFAKTCTQQLDTLLDELTTGPYLPAFGLSPKLWTLACDTWRNRGLYPHAFGRFDVSGVVDGQPAVLIEYNADTATVLAEAALVQELQLPQQPQWNDIVMALADQLIAVARQRPEDERDVLVVTLGNGEDDDNARVWLQAAEQAGLHADLAHLPSVTISPEEGIFRELNEDQWFRYGIVVKMFPWDWVDTEEPELLDALAAIIDRNTASILNPPYAALMQSKAILVELKRRFPDASNLLSAGYGTPPAGTGACVVKPILGREGENVSVLDEAGQARQAPTPGDFAQQPTVWQAFTRLPKDSDGDHYQAGVYYAGGACGLAYRRRDGYVIDEDSEFIGCLIRG